MACHCRPWTANTVKRHRAWIVIISFGQYARSTSSGMACYHGPWTPHTIERSRSSHAIIALERQPRLNNVGRGMQSSPLDKLTPLDCAGRGMPSLPLDGKHGRTKYSVECHQLLGTTQMKGRRRAWHAITALGQHTWSDDVGRGMPSLPLDSTHGRTTSGVA